TTKHFQLLYNGLPSTLVAWDPRSPVLSTNPSLTLTPEHHTVSLSWCFWCSFLLATLSHLRNY
uniref:Uncharacterized protein n=1 Tax=Meleagris gallopavo TaxID=9103 RepID=A0A803YDM2_MELGA